MATLVSLAQVGVARASQPCAFTVTVSNTGSSALVLSLLSVAESSKVGATIGQPQFLTPQMPVGAGNPSIAAGSSLTFPFQVAFPSPNTPGVSPNAPAPGPAGMMTGQPPPNNAVVLVATAQTSDGSVASSSIVVPVLSATAPFPLPQGGALQFGQGGNLINGIITGVL